MNRVGAACGVAVALAVLVSGAAAGAEEPLHVLEALVDPDVPFELRSGTLGFGGSEAPSSGWALVQWKDARGAASNETLLVAARARVDVIRDGCPLRTTWTEPPGPDRLVDAVLACVPSRTAPLPNGIVEDLRITLDSFREAPQARVDNSSHPLRAETFRVHASGADCSLDSAKPGDSATFPQDEESRWSDAIRTEIGPPQLVAACTAGDFAMHAPTTIHYYGLNLWVSWTEGNELRRELVPTGTFEEQVDPALPQTRTVTQLFRVEDRSHPIQAAFPRGPTVTLHTAALAGAGHLVAGPATGTLQWDATRRQGRLEGFESDGAFLFQGTLRAEVNLTGVTREGPPGAVRASSATATVAGPALLLAAGGAIVLIALALAWWSYTRLAPDRVLSHPRRALIDEFVAAHPGVQTSAIAQALGLSWTKATYHLAVLRRAGRVTLHKVGGRTAAFPANAGFRGHEMGVALLRRPTPARIYGELRTQPGLDQAELAGRLGLRRPAVSKALQSLERAGLVGRDAAGRRHRYFPVEL